MWLIFVEAGFALCLLIFIVWWTMFSGQKPPPSLPKNEPPAKNSNATVEEE